MPRHWERIAQVTGHKFDVVSESFSLKNIMDASLLKYKEDIEVHILLLLALKASFVIWDSALSESSIPT